MTRTDKQKILNEPKNWEEIPNGDFFKKQLEKALAPWLSKIFGFHLLKLGNLAVEFDTDVCTIQHKIHLTEEEDITNLHVRAKYCHLPLSNKSIDACLVAHLLPYIDSPHELLREIDRVLVDDGWVIFTSFNRGSLLGLGRFIPVIRRYTPQHSHLITQLRLLDWLFLLNYEVVAHRCFQSLPINIEIPKVIDNCFSYFGELYFVVARKRTIPLSRVPNAYAKIPLRWQQRLVGTAKCSKTSARNVKSCKCK